MGRSCDALNEIMKTDFDKLINAQKKKLVDLAREANWGSCNI